MIGEIDELKVYAGDDIEITKDIVVTQPTLEQIKDFGEKKYFGAVHNLTSVGADMKWQLNDYFGIDYTKIDDYELFLKLTSQLVSSKKRMYHALTKNPEKYKDELAKYSEEELEEMKINPLQLVLKDIDFDDFIPYMNEENKQIILYDQERDITIDKMIYLEIVNAVRKIHGFKRNNEMPGNERARLDLIEDARDEAMMAQSKPYTSFLKPLISALSVKTGQLDSKKIMKMNIARFLDNIKRVSKIQDAEFLMQGVYSGFTSLKGVDKTRLEWLGNIE